MYMYCTTYVVHVHVHTLYTLVPYSVYEPEHAYIIRYMYMHVLLLVNSFSYMYINRNPCYFKVFID